MWPENKGKVFTKMDTTEYTTDSAAMDACKDNSACYGVAFISKNKYKVGLSETLTAGTGSAKAYVKGDEVYTAARYYWLKKNRHSLNSRVNNEKYTDLDSALTQCASRLKTCQGVVKEGSNEYYMYKDVKLISKDTHTAYLLTDDELVVTTMTVSSNAYSWTYKNPFTLSGAYGKWYSAKDTCLALCAKDSACGGCIYNGKQYRRAKGSTPHALKKNSAFIKTGKAVSFRGYTWTVLKDKKLSGYYSDKVYTSKASALKVCGAKDGCKGVTREGARKYRLNSSQTYKTVTGYKIWVQGSKTETKESYDWTPKSSWILSGTGKKYKTRAAAAKACAKKSSCTGYNKYGESDFRTVSGSGFVYKKDLKTYVRGGFAKSHYTVFHENYIFHVETPQACTGLYGSKFTTLADALDACVLAKTCKAVQYDGSKFQRAKSSSTKTSIGKACYVQGGKFVESDGYLWDHRPGKSLTGYYNGVTYTTDTKAYSACAGSSDCVGVTQEGTKKYRLNTDETTKTAKGQSAYIQASAFVLYDKYYWSEADGYRLPGYADGTNYKTRDAAMTACLTNSKCNGVTKETNSKYRLNTGLISVTENSMTAYVKGGPKIDVQEFRLTYTGYTWTYKRPFTLNGLFGSTFKTRNAALDSCSVQTKCLGVTKLAAGKYRMSKKATLIPYKGRAVWIQGGKVVYGGGYTWSKDEKKSLT